VARKWLEQTKPFLAKVAGNALLTDAATTTVWNALGKGVGFLIPLFVAAWYGVSADTDAFFFSYGVAIFLCTIFEPVTRSVIVPFIAEMRSQGAERPERFIAEVFVGMTVLVIAAVGLFLLVLKFVLPLITDFRGEVLRLAYVVLLEISPLVLLFMWTGILSGAMNAYRRFAYPAVSPAFRAVVAIAVIFALKGRLGVHAVAVGYVVGEVLRVGVLTVLLVRLTPLRFGPGDLKLVLGPTFRRLLKTSLYLNVALIAAGLNPVVDRAMASWLPPGNVSVLYYAHWLYIIPITLFLTGAMPVLLSHWSTGYYTKGAPELRAGVSAIMRTATVVAWVTSVLLIALSPLLTRLVLGRGEFPRERLAEVTCVLAILMAGLLPHCLRLIYSHALLALKDTRTMLKNALCVNALNIALNYALMWRMGAAGIALSTTLTQVFAFVFLSWNFSRKVSGRQ